ncbi:transposon ty3-I gag-pol polyprotein [Tanacetum coccineum]
MPEDSRILIMLGRPFLVTARAMIDVFNKKIMLRVGDDEVIFDTDQSNIDSKGKKGAKNSVADHLSRLENPHMEVLIEREIVDEFPDEHLIVLRSEFKDDEPWFGVPKALISDRWTHFCYSQLEKALQRYGVTHKLSTAYHPQSNGQTKVTNRAIKRTLKRSVGYNPKDWSFYMAYPGPRWKEIDNVGEVSINLAFLLINLTWRIYRAKHQREFPYFVRSLLLSGENIFGGGRSIALPSEVAKISVVDFIRAVKVLRETLWLSICQTDGLVRCLSLLLRESGSGVHQKGSGTWHSNDIKVDIPEYDGKLDPDEFVEWLRTVEKEEGEGLAKDEAFNEAKVLALCNLPEDDPQTLVWYLGGLETRVANVVELYPYSTLDELTLLSHKGLGHIASECPNKKLVTLAEYEEGDNSYAIVLLLGLVVIADSVVEKIMGPDEGACLVVRRTLSNIHDREENLQREAIFHTRCLDETEPKALITPNPHIQPLLHSYNHVFPAKIPSGLPPLRTIQHKVDFIPGSVLPNKPAYHSNPQETEEMRKQVDGLLQKGLIRESLSLCVVPTILVPKNNEEWRMCMDSRSINKITIKYHFPIPRINDLLDELYGTTVFSKVDLRSGYHQIRIYEGDEWKTTFKTKEGLYEWLVMPFGLSNAPSTFMHLMNQEKLYGNLDKCEFFTTEVTFLGYLVSAQAAFKELKKQLSSTPILALPCFDEVFEVECDASEVGIGVVLSRLGEPIAYFNEKLNETKQRCWTYDKEFYAIVRALDQWQHYLISKEFILHSHHEALKYIQGQHKLCSRHAKWVEYLQAFNFTIQHKLGKLNKGADALSHKYSLVNSLRPRVVGLELLPQNYPSDLDFGEQFSSCQNHATSEYHMGHLDIDKTLKMLQNHFLWPKMERDVEHYVLRCLLFHQAKSHSSPYGLYMPSLVPVALWEEISLDFVIGLPRTQRQKDSIMKYLDSMESRVQCHPQTDGQTEVTNCTLGSLLRSLINTNLKQWDELLPRAEFAYNRAPNKTTGRSPFMVVYGLNLKTPLDLAVLDTSTKFNQEASDRGANIKALHQLVHDKISKSNELIKYRHNKGCKHILFQPGDPVWVHFQKDRFPAKHRSKLSPRGEGPFKILTKVNDIAYKVDLPGTPAAATFNVTDLQPYYDMDEPIPSLRANFLEAREDDRYNPPQEPIDVPDPYPCQDPSQVGHAWVSLIQADSI